MHLLRPGTSGEGKGPEQKKRLTRADGTDIITMF